jgi:hypothetical protein
MVDLSEFSGLAQAQEEGIDVDILHPKTGEELGIKIRVAGPDSARQKKARNAVNNERLAKSRNKRATAADLESDALKVTAASIISWDGVIENGQAVELNSENAASILTKYPFIYDQLTSAVGDRAGFIKS